MASPMLVRVLGYIYVAVSTLLWPTTIISAAFALKLKMPAARRPRDRSRPGLARGG